MLPITQFQNNKFLLRLAINCKHKESSFPIYLEMLDLMSDKPNHSISISTFKLAAKVYKLQVEDNRKSVKKLWIIIK